MSKSSTPFSSARAPDAAAGPLGARAGLALLALVRWSARASSRSPGSSSSAPPSFSPLLACGRGEMPASCKRVRVGLVWGFHKVGDRKSSGKCPILRRAPCPSTFQGIYFEVSKIVFASYLVRIALSERLLLKLRTPALPPSGFLNEVRVLSKAKKEMSRCR